MGWEWAEKRREAGRAHPVAPGLPVYPLGAPACSLCRGRIEGEFVAVGVSEVRDRYYHWYCYAHHKANGDV